MADRSRRVRPQIDDPSDESQDSSHDQDLDESEEEDYDPRKADAMRRSGRQETASATTVSPRSSGRTAAPKSSAAISKTSDGRGQSLKLTVKTAPSKLREVMRANEVDSLHDTLGGGQVLDGPRRRRNIPPARVSSRAADRPKYTEYGESDLEEDEEDEDRDQDLEMDDDAGSEDEDIEMEDSPMPPKAPKITLKPPAKSSAKPAAPKLLVTPATINNIKSVEDQEMLDDPGDEEVDDTSDLSDDDEEEDEEEEEEGDQTNLLEEDAPGEEDEMGNEEDAPGEEDDLEEDSDDESSETPGSGAATPDPAKLTKRQRKALGGEEFMALEMGPQQRKFFTDAEKAMKKDEHARKRKELTKRKIQEEKTAALNRLLKPQASKARGAAPKPETLLLLEKQAGETPAEEEEEHERANPLYTRWISTKDGCRLGVPEEWLGKKAGRYFGPPLPPSNGALVQEVD